MKNKILFLTLWCAFFISSVSNAAEDVSSTNEDQILEYKSYAQDSEPVDEEPVVEEPVVEEPPPVEDIPVEEPVFEGGEE
jgi:hypothetical protein